MKKFLATAVFFGFVLSIEMPAAAHAASSCDLSVQATALKSIQQDVSLSEAEELDAELNARHVLLKAAIACDQEEIAVRVDALSRIPDKLKTLPAYALVLENLADTARYYDDQKKNIDDLGLREVHTLARAIAAWRPKGYVQPLALADNFLLWADNQQFLERASDRLAEVNGVAFSLKLVNQDQINDLFKQAQDKLNIALDENGKARGALNQGRDGSALTYIQASLKALSDTYQIFFNLQKALEDIVK